MNHYAHERHSAIAEIVQTIDEPGVGYDRVVETLAGFVESEVKRAFTRGVRAAKQPRAQRSPRGKRPPVPSALVDEGDGGVA